VTDAEGLRANLNLLNFPWPKVCCEASMRITASFPRLLLATLYSGLLVVPAVFVGGRTSAADTKERPESTTAFWSWPAYCTREHSIGNMRLAVTNHGLIGTGPIFYLGLDAYSRDCFTRKIARSMEYPKDSRTRYLMGADLWVGAIVGTDTLVSTGFSGGEEFHPDARPDGFPKYRSTLDPAKPEYEGAISEEDYIIVYADTCQRCTRTYDQRDARPHRPLNIEVTQRSMGWSYDYADDFILLDYSLKNIGEETLRKVYVGLHVDAGIFTLGEEAYNRGYDDDLCGFRERQPALYLPESCPPDSDEINIAWAADNDGGLVNRPHFDPPVLSAMGTRVIRLPRENMKVNFNWWGAGARYSAAAGSFGPQTRDGYRAMYGDGYPIGDRDYYYLLSNGERDYDQPRLAQIGALDSVWAAPPSAVADYWSVGSDIEYLLSFGPFQIDPGRSVEFTLAIVGGSGFHQSYANFANLPDDLPRWYAGLNFDALGANATWAEWVFDNPGVDTDGDGYAGEFTICNLGNDSTWVCDTLVDSSATPDTTYLWCRWVYAVADTIWRRGDGVPDFRGAMPPPAPVVRVYPENARVRIVWNGARSETTPDAFSREVDFEGYRVYMARDERRSSFSMIASYDRENWNRYFWDPKKNDYVLNVRPFSLAELRCLYADSCNDTTWHPDQYPRTHPMIIPGGSKQDDQIFFFAPQDYNRSVLANDPINATTPIAKVYPQAPRPPILDAESIRELYPGGEDTLFLTEDGFIKYYEYELTVENLLPTVTYWFNVTSFDYGSATSGLSALETDPATNAVAAMAMDRYDFASGERPEVLVYPNPYLGDVDYRAQGFEGRGMPDWPVDRTRRIIFANLPPRCTISIYTVDGDLVRRIDHDVDPSDPVSQLDYWDLITRNSQQPVTGLYYWTVEDDSGNVQIGKLVIIL